MLRDIMLFLYEYYIPALTTQKLKSFSQMYVRLYRALPYKLKHLKNL